MLVGEIVGTLEQTPPAAFENGLVTVPFGGVEFLTAHGVHGLVHVRHDVEAVEDVDGLRGLLGEDFEIGLLHVAADELKSLAPLLAKPAEEAQQRLDLAVETDPQEASSSVVDLLDQGEVAMSALAGHLSVLPSSI